ncbi:MAG: restriction endonuclease subunit S, partial [Paludibacteraceae bacterium]|nr:restriction endonuclease subunit S [Paludibacteraceae bacterium]
MGNNTTFKLSPLGPIPSDWEVKELGEIAEFLDGKRKPIKDEDRSKIQGIYPYYGASGIIDYVNDYIFDDELILLGEDGANIINRSSPLAFKVSGKIWINNHAHVLKPINGYEIGFVTEFLESIKYDKYNTGTAQPKLNKEICSGIPVLCPPLPEQRAIAACLSAWDNAITKVQALLAQKELRKKWLMQQLLSGKKRLKGFGGEWKKVCLHEVAKEVSIKNKTDKQLTVLSCTKYDGLVPSLEYFGRKIFADDVSTYKVVPKNHFAYATNHIEEGSLGYQEILEEALISPMYTVFKTDSTINDSFFYKLLKSHNMVSKYQARMEGSIDRRGGLRWNAFSIIKIKLPSFEEQTAIAQVLQAADKEIQLLKAKVDKLKEEKKGLMQVLLTGK